MVDDPHVAFQMLCGLRDAHYLLSLSSVNDILHVDVTPDVFSALLRFCEFGTIETSYPLRIAGMSVVPDETVDPDIGFRVKMQ
jgi:hypothetical protein